MRTTTRRAALAFGILLALMLPSCNPIAERALEKRKRNAQNLASVYASAMAAGADFSRVKSKYDAIELMRRGVYGAPPFDTTLFAVPHLSDKEAEKASQYLVLDKESLLHYTDQRVP